MEVRCVTSAGTVVEGATDPAAWRRKGHGFVWLDFEACDDAAATTLRDEFGVHPQAIKACRQRTHLPTFHGYPDHWFVVVHRPLTGRAGHVHLLQLELFIRDDALITLHGPHNPGVAAPKYNRDTAELRTRLDSGRLVVKTPSELPTPSWRRWRGDTGPPSARSPARSPSWSET